MCNRFLAAIVFSLLLLPSSRLTVQAGSVEMAGDGAVAAASMGPRSQAELTSSGEPRPMTVDDALDIVNVGGGVMTPDGNWVLFTKSEQNWKDNKRETNADGGEPFQYLGEEGGNDFQFSPDSKHLTFARTVDKKRQLFLMRTTGGEAVQLTEHATSVGQHKWSADSTRIFFQAQDQRPEEEKEAIEAGGDVVFVNEGPNGQDTSYWSNIWAFEVANKEEMKITDERWLLASWDPDPKGTRLAVVARYRNRRNDGNLNEIFLVNVESGDKTRLTENDAPEDGVLWSPDGRVFIYLAADDQNWMNRNTKIWIMDPESVEHGLLSGKYEGNLGGVVWTPDSQSLIFSGQQGTNSNLFRMDVSTGVVEALTNVEGTLRSSSTSFSGDRTKYAYSFSDFDSPGDLYVGSVTGGEPVRLTDANPQIRNLSLADMKILQWNSHDGMEIEGLLHLPPGYEENIKVPLILNIHGGPAGSFPNSFRASYHIYAGLGYASLSPNVRGSSGYTDDLREGNTVAQTDGLGIGDYQDLITGVDALIEQDIVDPDRMGLRGWSYGGILGGWTITQTNRFKAASIGAGVYDWTSEYGPGFNHDMRLWHIGGTPWDNPTAWRERSALTHVKNVTTPTILLHGEEDTTDTEQQSMMFFVAIQEIGVPSRYLKFPRQPHGIQEPHHQRIRDIEEIRWMQQHILGEDWTPWKRHETGDNQAVDDEGGAKDPGY